MKSIKRTIRTFFTHPLFIMVYFIFCYELALLCKIGKVNRTLYSLLGCIVFFVILLILAIIPVVKNND